MSSTPTRMTDNARPTPASDLRVSDIQSSFSDSFTINVGILHPTDAGLVALQIATDRRYVSVIEEFFGKITWNLDVPTGVTAFFDNPAIEFVESNAPTPVRKSNTTVIVDWSNTAPGTQGLSFHYRINVLIVIDNLLVPINHDPTVHNDPPTP